MSNKYTKKIEQLEALRMVIKYSTSWWQVRGTSVYISGTSSFGFSYWSTDIEDKYDCDGAPITSGYISAEEFFAGIEDPEMKKMFLFNIDLWK